MRQRFGIEAADRIDTVWRARRLGQRGKVGECGRPEGADIGVRLQQDAIGAIDDIEGRAGRPMLGVADGFGDDDLALGGEAGELVHLW